MSIDFKVVEKGQPGVVGGGEKKFYAHLHCNTQMQALISQCALITFKPEIQ
jgi:hypothetical protein